MKYDVTFLVHGTCTIRVDAESADQAEQEAREFADDGFDLEDAEIEECWDVSEVKP